jgi:hypothetical protein
MINNQKRREKLMKFKKTAEFSSHTIWSSTNHADPQKAAEIVVDWDLGQNLPREPAFTAQIVWNEYEGQDSVFETIGHYPCFDSAKRALECEVTMVVPA